MKKKYKKEKKPQLTRKSVIMVVEDEAIIAKDIKNTLEKYGYLVAKPAYSAGQAIKQLEVNKPDLLIIDIMLNDNMDGINLATRIKKKYDIPIIYITAYADDEMLKRAKITEPYGYIIKPLEDKELRTTIEIALYKHRTEKKLRESFEKLKNNLEAAVTALATAVEMRDPYTAGHQRRVAKLSCAIALELDVDEDNIEGIRIASIIHDIGKIHIPAEILSKPSKLTSVEYEIVKSHSQIGHDIIAPIDFPWPVAEYVLKHHERINGSGYPNHLSNDQLTLGMKVLHVADVVEAMLSHRPYRPAHSIETTLKEITVNKGVLYEPAVVDTCTKLFKKNKFTFE
jgi:putative two-component system response regulator